MRWVVVTAILMAAGCASQWKVHGGPQECTQMCRKWGMELTGMVGVGDQSKRGGGASACVCEVPRTGGGSNIGAAGTTASTSAAIVAMQVQQQQQQAAAQHH